ncbi:MAG: AAA family ATPase [Halioglobus sp.]
MAENTVEFPRTQEGNDPNDIRNDDDACERLKADVNAAVIEASGFPAVAQIDVTELVPPRQIIWGPYIRGFLTGTAATGGSGKTSLIDVEVVSLAIGKDLLNSRKPLRAGAKSVLMFSLEDDRDEFHRRHRAVIRHYRLSDEEMALYRENVRVVFDSDGLINIASEDKGVTTLDAKCESYLLSVIQTSGADIVTIDPLISIHSVDENRNPSMQVVVRSLRKIARIAAVAIHYSHHNRKGGGDNVDDMRGAVALRDGSRYLRMLSRMTEEEAKSLGVEIDHAPFMVGTFSGKANFEPKASQKKWFRFIGHDLENGDDLYETDKIGVITQFIPKPLMHGITNEQQDDALALLKTAPLEDRRENAQAKQWIGNLVFEPLGITDDKDGRAKVGRIISKWKYEGLLEQEKLKNDSGRKQPYLTVK